MRLSLAFAACCAAALWAQAQEPVKARLRVTSNVPATLSLNHAVQGKGENWELAVAPDEPVLLRLAEPGYEPQWRSVAPMGPGERRLEAFRLEREPIPVLFRANVPAKVLLDGAEIGVTPFCHLFAASKPCRIVVRADGFQELVQTLQLSDGRPRVVDLRLLSDSGTILVDSEPAGAEVYLNGVSRKQRTPCTLERIRDGRHRLELRLDGYRRVEHDFAVAAGETVPLEFTLERLPAGLNVSTIPAGARIYVDGVYRGLSDLNLSDLPPGAHTLRTELPGYGDESRTIRLDAGATHAEEFRLRLVFGKVAVWTQPAVVAIYEGSRKVATTAPAKEGAYSSARTELSLPPGEHVLTFRAPGYRDETRTVSVQADRTAELKLQMVFEPNFEIVTRNGTYRGLFVKQTAEGHIILEIKPGAHRTFSESEIVKGRFLVQ